MSEIPTTGVTESPRPDRRRLIRTRKIDGRVRVYLRGDVLGTVGTTRVPNRHGRAATRWNWTPSLLAWRALTPPPEARAGRVDGACTTRTGAIDELIDHLIRHRAPAVAPLIPHREPTRV